MEQVTGLQVAATAVAAPVAGRIVAASFDGRVALFAPSGARGAVVEGAQPAGSVCAVLPAADRASALVVSSDSKMYDVCVCGNAPNGELAVFATLPAVPLAAARAGDRVVVVTERELLTYRNAALDDVRTPLPEGPTSVAAFGDTTAVGFASGEILLIEPNAQRTLKHHRRDVTALAFSPDGTLLLAADAGKEVAIWDVAAGETKTAGLVAALLSVCMARVHVHARSLTFHNGRVLDVAWHPNGTHFASVGLDGTLILWEAARARFGRGRCLLPHTHRGGTTAVAFVSDDTIVTAGGDGAVRTWRIGLE
jgi:WD repeat-containing protein 1 (actin-interacting protein 1)